MIRPAKIPCQLNEKTTKAFPATAAEYPPITNRFRPKRSLNFPEKSLAMPATNSAKPSIIPSANGAAPTTPAINSGISG